MVSREGTRRWQELQQDWEEAKLLLATLCLRPGRRTKPAVPSRRQRPAPGLRDQDLARAAVLPTLPGPDLDSSLLGDMVPRGTEQASRPSSQAKRGPGAVVQHSPLRYLASGGDHSCLRSLALQTHSWSRAGVGAGWGGGVSRGRRLGPQQSCPGRLCSQLCPLGQMWDLG